MVRLINKDNMKQVAGIVYKVLKVQEKMTFIAEYNNPAVTPCVYAMWHANQLCVHGLPYRSKTNVLISNSIDGQIIAEVCENWGFMTCRGSSQRKGSVSGTLKMITKLKNGEDIAIMVDGPRGPVKKVKSGAIILAREANVPIVPVYWYSTDLTFVSMPSWDKMKVPIGPCRILNVYGNPIYTNGKSDSELAQEIEQSLLHLEQAAPQMYNEAKKQKLWKKRK